MNKVVQRAFLERPFNQESSDNVLLSFCSYPSNLSSMLVMAFMMMSFVILSVEVLDMDEQIGKYLGGLDDHLPGEFFRALILILGSFFACLLS